MVVSWFSVSFSYPVASQPNELWVPSDELPSEVPVVAFNFVESVPVNDTVMPGFHFVVKNYIQSYLFIYEVCFQLTL